MFLHLFYLLQSLTLLQPMSEQLVVEKLNNKINSKQYDEINPVLSRDGSVLYYTRVATPDFNRTLIENEKDVGAALNFTDYNKRLIDIYSALSHSNIKDPVANPFNQDVWVAQWSGNDFEKISHPDYPLNSALPNSVCSITPQQNELVIINEYYKDGSMYSGFSTIQAGSNGNWHFPKPIYIYDFFSNSPDVNLTMNNEGNVLIMSLNRPSSLGSNDLYASFKVTDNLYSTPQPLKNVNTSFRETTPFISRDGNYIYFSSNRPNGIGGSDIYYAQRLDDSWLNWSEPVLLPAPINSSFDDAQPYVNEAHGYIYFSSKREGSSDIYRVKFNPIAGDKKIKTLLVRVINSLTGQPIAGEIAIGKESDGFYNKSFNAKDGTYSYQFVDMTSLILKPRKNGYNGTQKVMNPTEYFGDGGTYKEITLFLDPLANETTFTLDNIYFVQSTATIVDQSYPNIDLICNALKNNPNLKIKISGHTDNVGSPTSLMNLSKDRANAIKEYLVMKGIDEKRITTEGFGGTKPLNDNTTEEKKSKNRRVEFTVYK